MLLLAAVLAGCGGSSTPRWRRSLPCLREHAVATVDAGRPMQLPFRSTEPPDFRLVTAPKSFERKIDLSFHGDQPGANGAQLLFYDSDESPRRLLERLDRTVRADAGGAEPVGVEIERVGPQILVWSSAPTPSQRTAIGGCL